MGSTGPLQDLGMVDALATGLKLGETRRANIASEGIQRDQNKINQTNVNLRSEELGAEKSRLSSQLAKQTFDEAQTNRTNTMKAVENLSMYMNGKNKQEQEMFKTTDHYKEVSKLVKDYAPEFYDKDKKEIVTLSLSTMAEDKMKQNVARIQQKILDRQQILPEEQQYLDVIEKVGPKMIAEALEITASTNIESKDFNAEFQRNIQGLMMGRNTLTESYQTLGNPFSDPLGIMRNYPLLGE